MPTWRCPHCGTPQEETARCWVCRRSSTACGTCRHFRRSVAAQLGYCGLDRRRTPLAGDEIRGCWESARAATTSATAPGAAIAVAPATAPAPASRLDFIEVAPRGPVTSTAEVSPAAPAVMQPRPPVTPAEPGWNLWGDADL